MLIPTVTGGAGTLGLSATRALLEHGCTGLCIWDLETTLRSSQPSITKLAQEFPTKRVFSIAVDVTEAEAIAEATATTVSHLGGINHLFTFAGIVSCVHAHLIYLHCGQKAIV